MKKAFLLVLAWVAIAATVGCAGRRASAPVPASVETPQATLVIQTSGCVDKILTKTIDAKGNVLSDGFENEIRCRVFLVPVDVKGKFDRSRPLLNDVVLNESGNVTLNLSPGSYHVDLISPRTNFRNVFVAGVGIGPGSTLRIKISSKGKVLPR